MKQNSLKNALVGLVIASLAALLTALAPSAHAAAPTITSISPASGPASTSVVITGVDLYPFSTVYFGTTATSYTAQSSSQLTAVAPAGSGTVPVTVVTPSGTSNAVSYTYGALPPPPPPSFGPGDSITSDGGPPAGSWCTVGAVGYDDFDRLVAITAGHCTTRPAEHQEVFLSNNPGIGPIGTYETVTTNWPGFPSTQFPADSSKDYAVILLDPTKITPRNTTPNGTLINQLPPVGTPAVGQIMCKYGQVSATTCGIITSTANNVIRSWAAIVPGDSGGPVTVNGYWVGVNSAINPLAAPPSQFTGVAGILADIASQGPNTVGIGFQPLP